MSRTPITQAQYEAVMGINESTFRCDGSGKDDVNARPTSDFPVERVNWYQAIAFCNKLSIKEGRKPCYSIPGISALNLTNNETAITGWRELEYSSIPTSSDAEADKWDAATCKWDVNGYRLPTEAEWEYTARGGQKSQSKTGQNNYDYYYSGGNTANNVAWYSGNNNVNGNPRGTKAVGKKTENELGLYDMSGNVWEWCWDWHLNYYTSSDVTNPHGATSGSERILRGGSWDYEAPHCRVSNRGYNNPYFRYSGFGFRVACSAVTE
jgi:formylglycine-generating enzyme required for sulfatase activity